LKKLPRILAIDDGSFKPRQKGKALLLGIVSRLDNRVEGIVTTSVSVDGLDSTRKIIKMLKESKFKPQVKYIMLDGINFAGFNFVDLPKLNKELGIPVIAVLRKKPRIERIESALQHFKDKKKRLKLIEKAGEVKQGKKIFFQCCGCDEKTVKTILAKTTKCGNLPEPLRLAHLAASGVSLGESTRP